MEEEIQDDVAEDTNSEVEEDTNISEDGTQLDVASNEDTEAIKTQLADALKAKAELTVRAKKAEEEAKTLKAKPQENKPNDPPLSEELKLIARGLSDEAIEQAKIIAKGKDISLTEAIKDPLFDLYQQNEVEKGKKEKAKLGASKGSGQTEKKLKGTESGSTRDEHKKAFEEAVGK